MDRTKDAVSSFEKTSPGIIPFRFEGKDYFTAEELARAFAESEIAWMDSASVLSYIRRWFESNRMFEEAVNMGNYISDPIPERGLLRFVYRNAKRPLSLFGKLTAPGNLEALLRRAANGEASDAERRVAEMLADGRLSSLYNDYVILSGAPRDSFLCNLLLFMEGKGLQEQLKYFQVLQEPEAYFWPESVQSANGVETIDALRKIGAIPLRHDELKALERTRVLPKVLFSMLGNASTYTEAAELLYRYKAEGLLLPKNSNSAEYEKLSFDEYEKLAWRTLGHTQAVLERIDILDNALQTLAQYYASIYHHRSPPEDIARNSIYSLDLKRAAERLRQLKEARHTPADSLFISEVTNLLKRINSPRNWSSYCIAGCIGGLGGFLYSLAIRETGLLFTLIGVILGCANNYVKSLIDPKNIYRQIAEACAAYLSQIPEN